MAKEFDVVILGASGFTGQIVVEELARNAHREKIKWAVAGRNVRKVQHTLLQVQKNVSDNMKEIKIFEADVAIESSLESVCQSTKLVINCVGPYEKYGEPVVAACLKSRTHIIDMTVELMFINRMILKYYEEAESQGVYIVSACGVGHLFSEMAIPVLQQKFEGDIDAIDFHIKPVLKPGSVHFATWESVVNMSDGIIEVLATRQKIYSQIMKKTRSKWSILSLSFPIKQIAETNGLSLNVPSVLHTAELGLDMKMDAPKEKPIKVNSYLVVDSFWVMIQLAIVGFIFLCLFPFSRGRRLLTDYAEIFTCGLVTKSALSEEEKDSAKADFTAIARGWSQKQNEESSGNLQKRVVLRASGPPAYKNTAICLVQAAITVLEETGRLPNRGGVYTPVAAFSGTSLPSRLQKHGIIYQAE